MILTEINKVALQCENKLPFPVLQKGYSNSITVTWTVQLRCDAVFMTSSPSSSPRFLCWQLFFGLS